MARHLEETDIPIEYKGMKYNISPSALRSNNLTVELPEVVVRPTTPQTNDKAYYQRWLMRQANRGGRNMSSSDREAYDRMMQRIANQNEVKNFTGFDGTIYNHGSGALEQVSPEFDVLTLGRQLYTDGILGLIDKSAGRNIGNTINRGKLLYNIEKTPVNNDKLLNDAMLNDLTFVNGAFRSKSSLGAKTVEDVASFTYGLPKGITPKTKLSSLTNNQIYDLALRDIKRESGNDWFIGIGNSAKNNRYIHMDANSSIIPTTEGFLPTREGFTKVGRYGTPEIWYNKNIPYYPIELSKTPRTVVTTQKALGIEDVFENVAHTPRTLKYEDILYGLEPNEFGSYNRVLYSPYKRVPLNNTPYNPSTLPNNIFNIKTMNKYRRFKYPFGGETPQEFADARRAYYENVSNSAMQAINATPVINANTVTQPFDETSPREYLRQYTERVRPEVERKVNEMNIRPSGNGRIIRNHDKLYDYYKDGDKLYYRKKGGKNWIDISDNDVAQKRINATIARNKRSYGKPKTSSDEYTPEEMRAQGFVQNNKGYWVRPKDLEDSETYDADTLNDVVVTGTRHNTPSSPRRVQGSTAYKSDTINDIVKNAIYGKKPQFTPSKVKPSSTPTRNVKPQGRRLTEPKTRPYTYHGGRKYNIYTDGKGNWIE